MHIVHVEDFFHPNAGYKYNIISKFFVKFGHNVTIVAPNLDNRDDILTDFFGKENIAVLDNEFKIKYGVDIVRVNVNKYFRTRALYNLSKLNKLINDLKPDILSIGSELLPYYYYLLKMPHLKFPIVFDCHNTETCTTSKFAPFHRFISKTFFSPIINKYDIRVIRCVNDDYIEKCLNIPVDRSPIVSFGSDLSLFFSNNDLNIDFKKKNGLTEQDLVFTYIGKMDKSKGGLLLVKTFHKKFKTNKKVCLQIVGTISREDKEEIDYYINTSENLIVHFETQKYIDLPKYYQSADVAIFPKQCSLSFFDAQACGLPVIAEDYFVNIERLSHNNGLIFDHDNANSLRENIQKIIDMPFNDRIQLSKNAIEFIQKNYNYEDRAKEYLNILINEYNKFHDNNGYLLNKSYK